MLLCALGAHGLDQRRLLEWKTASDLERGGNGNLKNTFREMAVVPPPATAGLLMLVVVYREAWLNAGPWIAVWTISPLVACWPSQPICRPALRLSENQHRFLEKVAKDLAVFRGVCCGG